MHIMTTHRSGFLPAPIRITLNDLEIECPIQLKVRFTDGTLDVRLLRVSDSTIRLGVTRGAEGEGAGRLSPPCGQLTRCFSRWLSFLFTFIRTLLYTAEIYG